MPVHAKSIFKHSTRRCPPPLPQTTYMIPLLSHVVLCTSPLAFLVTHVSLTSFPLHACLPAWLGCPLSTVTELHPSDRYQKLNRWRPQLPVGSCNSSKIISTRARKVVTLKKGKVEGAIALSFFIRVNVDAFRFLACFVSRVSCSTSPFLMLF